MPPAGVFFFIVNIPHIFRQRQFFLPHREDAHYEVIAQIERHHGKNHKFIHNILDNLYFMKFYRTSASADLTLSYADGAQEGAQSGTLL